MYNHTINSDLHVTLLLCLHLEKVKDANDFKPLTPSEFAKLTAELKKHELHLTDLLDFEFNDELKHLVEKMIGMDRLLALLKRAPQVAFLLDKWQNAGVWIISQDEQDYPSKLKEHLAHSCPPLLFGIGDPELMNADGIAIVGSRDVDFEGEQFTREVAVKLAEDGILTVSGGARGVDSIAMTTAIETGGCALGVMADRLIVSSLQTEYRDAILNKRLLLISPYNPEMRFSTGNAMGRNKLIYSFAKSAIVVSSSNGTGGTWSGATEELKRKNNRTVFVRIDENAPEGNRELLKKGAIPFPEKDWSSEMLLKDANRPLKKDELEPPTAQLSLF